VLVIHRGLFVGERRLIVWKNGLGIDCSSSKVEVLAFARRSRCSRRGWEEVGDEAQWVRFCNITELLGQKLQHLEWARLHFYHIISSQPSGISERRLCTGFMKAPSLRTPPSPMHSECHSNSSTKYTTTLTPEMRVRCLKVGGKKFKRPNN